MNNHRMRKLAFLNQKGGVGKTTSAVNLAAALAAGGHRVCLVDLDPQAHASLHLNVVLGPDDPSIYDVLTGEMTLAGARHEVTLGPLRDGCDDIQHHNGRLCVVGAHINLAAAEVELVSVVGREMILADRIAEDVAQADEEHTWDYLILDCPPSQKSPRLHAAPIGSPPTRHRLPQHESARVHRQPYAPGGAKHSKR